MNCTRNMVCQIQNIPSSQLKFLNGKKTKNKNKQKRKNKQKQIQVLILIKKTLHFELFCTLFRYFSCILSTGKFQVSTLTTYLKKWLKSFTETNNTGPHIKFPAKIEQKPRKAANNSGPKTLIQKTLKRKQRPPFTKEESRNDQNNGSGKLVEYLAKHALDGANLVLERDGLGLLVGGQGLGSAAGGLDPALAVATVGHGFFGCGEKLQRDSGERMAMASSSSSLSWFALEKGKTENQKDGSERQ